MPRPSVRTPPSGDTPKRIADKMGIIDDYTFVEYTPASGSDTSAERIRLAWDDDYAYFRVSTGGWKKVALSSF